MWLIGIIIIKIIFLNIYNKQIDEIIQIKADNLCKNNYYSSDKKNLVIQTKNSFLNNYCTGLQNI